MPNSGQRQVTSLLMFPVDQAEDFVVELTPPGRAAIASLLVDGPGAAGRVARFARCGRCPLDRQPVGRIVLARWGDGPAAEEVVVCRRSDERVEVHCHGGTAALSAIREDLIAGGCRPLTWQRWVQKRGEPDPLPAAARIALAEARTQRAAAVLLDQLAGALAGAVAGVRGAMAEGRDAEAVERLDELVGRAALGLRLVVPWRVVLAGAPNVGKSSLINRLVGYERSIVYDRPGTTRDVVTAATAIDGWPVELSDTAGLRADAEALEAAGMELALERLSRADLVVLVFDATRLWTDEDERLAASWPESILVHNKSDLARETAHRPSGIWTSATRGDGVGKLVEAIGRRLVPDPPPPGAAVPFSADQLAVLKRARDAIAAGRRELALAELRRLDTG